MFYALICSGLTDNFAISGYLKNKNVILFGRFAMKCKSCLG